MAEENTSPKEDSIVKKVLVTIPNKIVYGPRTAEAIGKGWNAMMDGHPVDTAKLSTQCYDAAVEDWKARLHIGKGKGGNEVGG